MSEIVEGLDTTSDKIRALLRESYLRGKAFVHEAQRLPGAQRLRPEVLLR